MPPARPPGGGQMQGFRGEGSNKSWPEQKSVFYYTIVEAMLKFGFHADEIGKIVVNNFCRVFDLRKRALNVFLLYYAAFFVSRRLATTGNTIK